MKQLVLTSLRGKKIRFDLYWKRAPKTCQAFLQKLPFSARGVQARFAGEEIWVPKGPALKIPFENASILLKVGEIGCAPVNAKNPVSKSVAVVYGEAKLSGKVNVFARAVSQDRKKLKKLGEEIWLKGAQRLRFQTMEK